MKIEISIDVSGPVFDGTHEAIMDHYVGHVTSELGDIAVNRIRKYLPEVYEYPRDPASLHGTQHFNPGLYVSDIHTDRMSSEINLVNDTPVVYGPWVEGVGSCNDSTRFKGHHAFRKIAQQLEAEAGAIADMAFQPYLAELNG